MTFLYWFKQQWSVSGDAKILTMAVMFQGIKKLDGKKRNRLADIIENEL